MLELIEILTRLLLGFFMYVGVWTVSPANPPAHEEVTVSPADNAIVSPTNITSVEVMVLELAPTQVQLKVHGEQPDGCDLPVQVDQTRQDNRVTVTVYRELPPDLMCPMILVPYDAMLPLEGSFEPGDYVFRVNDFVVEQTL